MGGWYYMRARLDHLRHDMKFISRKKSASPANGLMKRELAFQEKVIKGHSKASAAKNKQGFLKMVLKSSFPQLANP